MQAWTLSCFDTTRPVDGLSLQRSPSPQNQARLVAGLLCQLEFRCSELKDALKSFAAC